jgi:pimeloyl-ACP methyl ester carboxylesterase
MRRMSELSAAGLRFHLLDTGAGPSALLLHSGGLSGAQWKRLAAALATDHRVLVPDFLGMGESEPWPADRPFHFSLDLEVAAAALERVEGAAHLIGHSYGGLLALHLALRLPARVCSLALYEPVAFSVLAPDDPSLAEVSQSDLFREPTDDAGLDGWLQRFIDYWSGAGAWASLPEAQRQAFRRVGRKLYGEASTLMRDRTPAEAFAAIRAPTLLLSGARSTRAAGRIAAVLAAAIPGASHEVLEGATHMAPLSDAAKVNARIQAHLTKVEQAG